MIGLDEPLILHEDTFYEYFIPYKHPSVQHSCWGDLGIETHSDDFKLVKSLDINYVWTVVDDCEGMDQWIVPEIHLVNRVCYLVTKRPHNGFLVEFRCPRSLRSLTVLGIKRQIGKLERCMSLYVKQLNSRK